VKDHTYSVLRLSREQSMSGHISESGVDWCTPPFHPALLIAQKQSIPCTERIQRKVGCYVGFITRLSALPLDGTPLVCSMSSFLNDNQSPPQSVASSGKIIVRKCPKITVTRSTVMKCQQLAIIAAMPIIICRLWQTRSWRRRYKLW